MIRKYRKEGKWYACSRLENENIRFDQEDPCKGASQIIGGYKKWGQKYIDDVDFNDRLGNMFDKKKEKILEKLECE